MKLDLTELRKMHPLLPTSTAIEYGHRAAVGLERNGHTPGAALATRFDLEEVEALLHWLSPHPGAVDQLDKNRVTEDAAEAIALAFVHVARGWVARRRAQRGESADWWFHDSEARPVALEVSGIDKGDAGVVADRLRTKVKQVQQGKTANQRAACVVVLSAPAATVATA